MKFWQLFLISMLAMAAVVKAQEQPPEAAEPEEEHGDDEGHAEPEAEPAADDDEGAEEEDDGAASEPEPEGTDEPQEVDAGNGDDEHLEVEESHPDHINEVETKAVEMEEVIESSKTAGLESDNGANSACFSFSTVILSTLVALKFAH